MKISQNIWGCSEYLCVLPSDEKGAHTAGALGVEDKTGDAMFQPNTIARTWALNNKYATLIFLSKEET